MSAPDPVTRLNSALEGRYRIERELGAGGMATVYLARDQKHNRSVALKVLKPELAAVVGAERFLAEIETTANLQHPHILPLFDSGEADGFLFYVMPYVEGESLRERLDREHQLPVEEAVQIAKDVAEALQAAHEQGVIHRDVKPANILLSKGRPLVSDFGIALALGAAGAGRLTETGLSLGTPHYMSPEQATGDLSVGAATDVYALGCVLYEMLVGEPPFTGSTPQAVLGKIVTGEAPSASAGRKSVPPNVDAAIRKALEKVPADRFAAVQDLGKALGDPGFHHGEAAVAVAPPQVASRRRLMMLGWGVAAVLAVGWVWSTMRGSPTQPIVRFEVPLPQGWIRATTSGKTVDISPDGTSIVFVAVQPGEGSGLWIRRLGQLAAVPIPGTEGGANPRFSPDGGSVSFSRGGRLLTVALGGGEPRTLVPDSVPLVGGAAWAPDGTLYFTRSSGEIWRVSETGAGLSRVTTLADGDIGHFSPDVLPEGESLLFTQLRGEFLGENQLAVLSLETGELKSLGVQSDMGRVSPTGHLVFPARQGAAGGLVDLMAAPFDLDRLEVTGPEQVVAERIGVTATSSSSFAVSSTGVLVYEPGNLEAGLIPVWVDRDGAQEPLDPGLPVGQYNTPSISPDGSRVAIAYSPNATAIGQIWLYDIDQGGTFVPFATDAFNAVPFWSPDGREVGFLSDRGSPGFNGIYAAPWGDGAQARLVRPARGQSIWDAAWMPDGQVVHRQGTRAVGQRTGIYVGPPDPDAALVTVVETDATESSPTVSPDGRWLAYEADQTGRFEVYVRPLPGPGASTQVSLDGAVKPLWSHGGSEIFFWTNDSVAVARVRTEPSFAVESRETLFSLTDLSRPTAQRPYDVAPDDSRLLMLRRVTAPGESAPYAVILNFTAELEGRGG